MLWARGRGTHDYAVTHPGDLRVPVGVGCCHLLHARNFAARRGSIRRWSRRRVFRHGCDRSRQCVGVVARTDHLDTVLRGAVLPRARHLGYANLPRYLAVGSPVRVAWVGGAHRHRGDHRPTARLPVRGNVPGVDGLLAGRGTHPRRRRDLCRYRGHWARGDAPNGRLLTKGPITQQILNHLGGLGLRVSKGVLFTPKA